MPPASRAVYDADSHVMEPPDWLITHADPSVRDRLEPLWMRGLADFATGAIASMEEVRGDPAARAALEAAVPERKNWWALGATEGADRGRVLDILGLRGQLVFSTHSSRSLLSPVDVSADLSTATPQIDTDLELIYGAVRAHNRAIADFCSHDQRLMPVAWVRLDDPELSHIAAAEALALGCAAIEVPSYQVGPRSLTHVDFEPLYAMLEERRCPLVFHLGSGGELPSRVFRNNGRPVPADAAGNLDPMRPLRAVGLSAPVETAVAALILDGVLEAHPQLKVGVIEQGAVWVPGFLRKLDLAVEIDRRMRGQERLPGDLPHAPSEYVLRQVRFTPFPQEPLDWVIEQTDPSLYLFSTDYPHVEGGEDPRTEFELRLARCGDDARARFFVHNFEDLMALAITSQPASAT